VRGFAQIVAGAALIAALAACGSSGSSSSRHSTAATSATTSTSATTPGTHKRAVGNVNLHRCVPASPALVHSIQIGLNGKGGKTLTHTYAVLSNGTYPKAPAALHPHVYFVSASVLDKQGKPDIATWVTGNLNGHALIYPASSLANDISTFHKIGGSSSKPRTIGYGILPTSDGYRISGKCVKRALAGKPA
jgi:hypothetical protein